MHRDALLWSTPQHEANHSHSIVLRDLNALNYKRQFFCARRRTVFPIRQKFALLNSKGNFGDPRFARFQQLSASIGRFSTSPPDNEYRLGGGKKTVTHATRVATPPRRRGRRHMERVRLFHGLGQVNSFDHGKSGDRQSRRHERAVASFNMGRVRIAHLHRSAGDTHQSALRTQFGVLLVGGISRQSGRRGRIQLDRHIRS